MDYMSCHSAENRNRTMRLPALCISTPARTGWRLFTSVLPSSSRSAGLGLWGSAVPFAPTAPARLPARPPRGVCGADADLMVARNLFA